MINNDESNLFTNEELLDRGQDDKTQKLYRMNRPTKCKSGSLEKYRH